MPDSFHVAEPFRAVLPGEGTGFAEGLAILGLEPRDFRARSTVLQRRLEAPGAAPLDVHVKVYAYTRHRWRKLLRVGRVGVERRGLAQFQALGLDCPEVVAWGSDRSPSGRLRRECLVTRTVPATQPLEQWVLERRATPQGRRARQLLVARLAAEVRRLHDAGYFHRDLRWRNLMIREGSGGEPIPVWHDSPRGLRCRVPLLMGYFRLRELARMDRAARARCTLRERAEFLRRYLGDEARDGGLRRWWTRLARYSAHRWRPRAVVLGEEAGQAP
jgi:hypothetical protein